MPNYKLDDFVVHGRDIGKVVDIFEQDGEKYYKIQSLYDTTLSVRTPVAKQNEYIRPVINKQRAEELIDMIVSIEPIEIETRTAEATYSHLIKSGNHVDIIRLIKTSYLRCEEKTRKGMPKHEKDKTYLRLAERLLYSEFAIALGKTYEETKQYIIDRICETEPEVA